MNKNTLLYILIICIHSSIMPLNQANAASDSMDDKITMAFYRKETSADGKALKFIYTEAFNRLGKTLVYRYFPAKRGSLMADNDQLDGDSGRVYNYNEGHPNMIRVEEPIFSVKFSAFSTNPDIKLNGWNSLIGTDYKVEYTRGTYASAQNLIKVVDKKKLSRVSHWSQGIKKLAAGRSDIFIEAERTVLEALKTSEFINSNIHIAGVMETQTVHAFLHIKHKFLASKLSAVLKEMKKEGLIEKYFKDLNSYDARHN